MNQSEDGEHMTNQSRSKVLRILFIIAGFVFLTLGCVGIAIPILPTVPFFLLTSYCFVKGSKKFHLWFISSQLYSRYLEGFVRYKSMNIIYELILLLLVSAILTMAMVMVNNLFMTIFVSLILAIKYVYFIVMIKPISPKEMNSLKLGEKDE